MNRSDRKTEQADRNAREQRRELLDSERDANKAQARNFKEDALDDKVVSVEPDGTGPTSTQTFDVGADRALGSGNNAPGDSAPGGGKAPSGKAPSKR